MIHYEQLMHMTRHGHDWPTDTDDVTLYTAQAEDAHKLLVGGDRAPAVTQADRLITKTTRTSL